MNDNYNFKKGFGPIILPAVSRESQGNKLFPPVGRDRAQGRRKGTGRSCNNKYIAIQIHTYLIPIWIQGD